MMTADPRDPDEKMEPQRVPPTGTPGAAGAANDERADAQHALALTAMQEGYWQTANEALEALTTRFPDSAGVRDLRQLLALRIAAEENWEAAARSSWRAVLATRTVRALAIANAVLYLVVAASMVVATILGAR